MPSRSDAILEQIDDLISQYEKVREKSKWDDLSDLPDSDISELATRLISCIRRFAPKDSVNCDAAEAIMKQYGVDSCHTHQPLLGILKALRADYGAGYMTTVEEMIHADLFADFLEMAEHLIKQGYKDPAAVMIGSVLEEHLRKLSTKNSLPIVAGSNYKKASTLNADLARVPVYSKLDQKSIIAWLDLRNKAAHGYYGEYSKEQVQLMLEAVRNFMVRHKA